MFNDNYDIDGNYQKMRKLMNQLESDLYKFIGPTKNKSAAIRARRVLGELKDLSHKVRVSISKQRQDNNSEY
jgi:hypothetical protein